MSPEKKRYVYMSLVATMLAIAVLPNISEQTPASLVSVVTGMPPNCTDVSQKKEIVLAVFGSGVFVQNENRIPDDAGRMRLEAAAEYYRQNNGHVGKIVLLDGKLYPKGEEVGKKYLLRIEPSIPSEIVFSDQDSINTPTNADELTKLTSESDQIVGITNYWHLPRAIKYICAKGRRAIGIAAEKILNIPMTTNINTIIKEKLGLLFSIFLDNQGYLVTELKKID